MEYYKCVLEMRRSADFIQLCILVQFSHDLEGGGGGDCGLPLPCKLQDMISIFSLHVTGDNITHSPEMRESIAVLVWDRLEIGCSECAVVVL